MRKRIALWGIFFVFTFTPFLLAQTAQPEGKRYNQEKPTKEQLEQAKQMKEYFEKFGTPGPEHVHFKKFVGTWNGKMRSWNDPKSPPMTFSSISISKLIHGGRFLMTKTKGSMMGQPFEGLDISGYDRAKKKFFHIWFDNMSTGFYPSMGTCNADYSECVDWADWDDPMKKKTMKVKQVTKFKNNDEYSFTMYVVNKDGKSWKMMEGVFTRVTTDQD